MDCLTSILPVAATVVVSLFLGNSQTCEPHALENLPVDMPWCGLELDISTGTPTEFGTRLFTGTRASLPTDFQTATACMFGKMARECVNLRTGTVQLGVWRVDAHAVLYT